VQRLIVIVLILFIVSFGSFYLIHLLPGDPTTVLLGFGETEQSRRALLKLLGLNKPLLLQYTTWMSNVLRGNLGTSPITDISVRTSIAGALPIDGELILLSQIMALGAAIPLAFRAARHPGGRMDRITTSASFLLLSIPSFVVITLLVDILALDWHVPYTAPNLYTPGGDWVTNLYTLLLPAFTLALGSFVVYYRVLRSDLISTYQEEFITLARSKGLSRRRIVWRHAFRPSSISLLGTAGLVISGLVAGTFIVEFLTGIPGMGFTLIQAIGESDYLLVQAIVLVVAAIVVFLNFFIDLLFGFIDPRIGRE
jgi:peptide/nickel transport system permease protein